MVFDTGDVVLRWATRVRIDPLVDAELGLGFLQSLGYFFAFFRGGAARQEIGLGLGERGERAMRLALVLRFPVKAVGALDDVALHRRALGCECFLDRRR